MAVGKVNVSGKENSNLNVLRVSESSLLINNAGLSSTSVSTAASNGVRKIFIFGDLSIYIKQIDVTCINLRSGETVWETTLPTELKETNYLVIEEKNYVEKEGFLYIFQNGYVGKMDIATGSILSFAPLGGTSLLVKQSPFVYNNEIYFVYEGTLFKLDTTDLSKTLVTNINTMAATGKNNIVRFNDHLYYGHSTGLKRLNLKTLVEETIYANIVPYKIQVVSESEIFIATASQLTTIRKLAESNGVFTEVLNFNTDTSRTGNDSYFTGWLYHRGHIFAYSGGVSTVYSQYQKTITKYDRLGSPVAIGQGFLFSNNGLPSCYQYDFYKNLIIWFNAGGTFIVEDI